MSQLTTENPKIEVRKQRIEQLKNDCEIMRLVRDGIENIDIPIQQLLQTRIQNNILDRMLILKEIEIISQQPWTQTLPPITILPQP